VGTADELALLASFDVETLPVVDPGPDDYAPTVRDGRRWITRLHREAASAFPGIADGIRVMPHPQAVTAFVDKNRTFA
jgi:hypothetical protein